MKIVRSLIVFLVLIFATLLWLTKDAPMISQSAFALSPNNHWYVLMHLSIIITFILDAVVAKKRLGWFVAIASAGTLSFNMFDFPFIHNLFTALIMATAVFNIIYYSSPKTRPYAIVNSLVGILIFLLGLFTNVHLFFAEVVAEFAIGVAIARRIWIEEIVT